MDENEEISARADDVAIGSFIEVADAIIFDRSDRATTFISQGKPVDEDNRIPDPTGVRQSDDISPLTFPRGGRSGPSPQRD